jgi:hypothetical protein
LDHRHHRFFRIVIARPSGGKDLPIAILEDVIAFSVIFIQPCPALVEVTIVFPSIHAVREKGYIVADDPFPNKST